MRVFDKCLPRWRGWPRAEPTGTGLASGLETSFVGRSWCPSILLPPAGSLVPEQAKKDGKLMGSGWMFPGLSSCCLPHVKGGEPG